MAKKQSVKVEAIRHKEKRANIPTEELRDFVAEEEFTPKTMLYPRDISLDPQLVWKGKEAQNREGLSVPVVPIYIQEKIHPQTIINDIARQSAVDSEGRDQQLDLFSDFNGGPSEFDQKIDFYHHEQNWTNRLILGDSLLVMTSLAEKEGLKGQVQMVFMDPPYGIKFGSNWQVSTRKRDVKDGRSEDVTRQPEQVRAFRDTWNLGVHSYLSYLRDRLTVTRELLTETGSVFVQIGDENVHLVRSVLDEIFGAENFVTIISFKKTGYQASSLLPSNCDFILWYAKNKEVVKFRQPYVSKLETSAFIGQDLWLEMPDGERRRLKPSEIDKLDSLPSGARLFRHKLPESAGAASAAQPIKVLGRTFEPKPGKHWSTTVPGMYKLEVANRLIAIGNTLRFVNYLDDFSVTPVTTNWTDTVVSGFSDPQVFVVQTATKVVQRCVLMTTDPGDLVVDPTCGSGTTAFVAEQWGRRWITCDTSRVALALARTRIMSGKYSYYLLADSPEGAKKEAELSGTAMRDVKRDFDIRKGFVYKRVPHVTLKAIANNPEIKEGMTRQQIDAVIERHAEVEMLHDQPYEDTKRIRVAGPFCVESLSPHRVLSSADDDCNGTVTEEEGKKQQDFVGMILANLKKAGVQNTKKAERLVFEQIEPYAGLWIHAVGEYEDADGKIRKAAISIGPEHGTVGPQDVKEAAKEAVQGVGFDLLIVCGFAFDPHVAEEATRYGKLTVLPTKMNPDLSMGDELLKKTGAGNLFMVFGEPDVNLTFQKDGQAVLEVKGVDVYDPTTGQIRSSSTSDIACWFIDTNYNGESFFIRHAYFTGGDEPFKRLQKAMKSEINESSWESLYTTKSRPFDKPKTGKVAVKVINHYGDEVLKVFKV